MQNPTRTSRCYRCRQDLPIDAFVKDCTKASGRASICVPCDKNKGREYYRRNRAKKLEAAHDRAGKRKRQQYVVVERRKCPVCQGDFGTVRKPGPPKRYCSSRCKSRAKYSPEKQRVRNARNHARRKAIRDSARLQATAEHLAGWQPTPTPVLLGPAPVRCAACDQVLQHQRKSSPKYCSPSCRASTTRPDKSRRPFIAGRCRECRASFTTTRIGTRYCSTQCSKRSQRRRGKQVRSKRIHAAAKREPINLATIAERDGWRCHICKRQVTRTTWSLDHLIPLADGGDHTHANTALAHHLCNAKRGRTGPAQLLLLEQGRGATLSRQQ